MSAPRTPEKYTASSAGTPVLGTPGSNAGATTVRWDLTPVEVPLHQLHYASEAALNGAPLLIRGRCDKTASMGLTKAGAPFYTLSLISLQEETVSSAFLFALPITFRAQTAAELLSTIAYVWSHSVRTRHEQAVCFLKTTLSM